VRRERWQSRHCQQWNSRKSLIHKELVGFDSHPLRQLPRSRSVGGGSGGSLGHRAQAVRRELDKVAQEEDVLRQSLEDFLFVWRFRQLRQRMMAAAQAQGIFTDEDVFNRVS